MKILHEQRDRLLSEMEALKNKIAGLEMAMALLNDEPLLSGSVGSMTTRINIKGTILELLRQTGTTGLNAQTAVELAKLRGIELGKGSVSSILSRFKREGTVVYEGDRYKLKQMARIAQMPGVSSVN